MCSKRGHGSYPNHLGWDSCESLRGCLGLSSGFGGLEDKK